MTSNSFTSHTHNKLLTGKKIFLKDFWPILTPNLRGQPLLFGIRSKVLLFKTFFVLQVIRNSWSFLRYYRKNFLGADPITPLRGHSGKNWKLYFRENMIPSNFCSITLFKMFVVFEIYEVKDSPVWAPKIPYYVIYDLKFIVYR